MKILLTGCAGFIGMHVAKILLDRGDNIIGIDSMNDYYDPNLKNSRLNQLLKYKNFIFYKADIADQYAIEDIFSKEKPQRVINLAAQPGVRYSITNPYPYIQSNVVGFLNILEGCRNNNIEHLVFSSSSSVYGSNTKMPFSTQDNVDHPLSLYAATKKANELMAHSYSHLYNLPVTGLRYFTVYGPWGRPDMSPWLFTSAIIEDREINIFNDGNMKRDFTFVEDIAEGTVAALDKSPIENNKYSTINPDPSSSLAKYKIYNIGNSEPEKLMDFIGELEKSLGKVAKKKYLPLQPGDVIETFADTSDFENNICEIKKTKLSTGVEKWIQWYKTYHKI
jgi:UDP-glucuronate 4-epimerase